MSVEVVAYTTPTCPHCQRLKAYLAAHHIPFVNRDVTSDEAAAAELQRMDAPGVPVVRVGDEVLIGFNPERLAEALRSHGVSATAWPSRRVRNAGGLNRGGLQRARELTL